MVSALLDRATLRTRWLIGIVLASLVLALLPLAMPTAAHAATVSEVEPNNTQSSKLSFVVP